MKSGITRVSSSLLCILAALNGGAPEPTLDLPRGYAASIYARGIEGARGLEVRADGTLTLRSDEERLEISPPTDDAPVTVMRVAADLATRDTRTDAAALALAFATPGFVHLRWHARSGELGYVVEAAATWRVPVSAETVQLARALARDRDADVALAPDGALYIADFRAGAVWRVERVAL